MSMLAERKQKQKWTLNPRGKYWSEDSNKFGQKMLEKMGWSKGKGLGANEDGITDHIKVSYKNNAQGIGFKDKDDQWTKHEDNFVNLLQSFEDKAQPDVNHASKSLEAKSRNSRVRVHYHKFTRQKDLSNYSEKDLANIFGRKTLEKQTESKTEEPVEQDNRDFGVATVEGGNMADYFKQKMKKLEKTNVNTCRGKKSIEKNNLEINLTDEIIDQEKESGNLEQEIDEKVMKRQKKKKKRVGIDNLGLEISEQIEDVKTPVKKKKKDISKPELVDTINTEKVNEKAKTRKKEGIDNFGLELNDKDDAELNIKKKKTGKKEIQICNGTDQEEIKMKANKKKEKIGIDNAGLEISDKMDIEEINMKVKRKKQIENDIKNDNSKGSKSKKRKKNEYVNEDGPELENNCQKSAGGGIDNPGFHSPNQGDRNEKRSSKKPKLEVIPEELDGNDGIESDVKIKKKKKKYVSDGIDNAACTATLTTQIIEEVSNKIDGYENEIENQINETKDNRSKTKKNLNESHLKESKKEECRSAQSNHMNYDDSRGDSCPRSGGKIRKSWSWQENGGKKSGLTPQMKKVMKWEIVKKLSMGHITPSFQGSNLHTIKGYANSGA